MNFFKLPGVVLLC